MDYVYHYYHYRLLATIALAEIARQVEQPPTGKPRPIRRVIPTYDFARAPRDAEHGETVFLEDREAY